jgi:hypothetical protein
MANTFPASEARNRSSVDSWFSAWSCGRYRGSKFDGRSANRRLNLPQNVRRARLDSQEH